MKPFCALLLLGLVAGSIQADPYSQSIQRARRTSDQNNAQQAALMDPAAPAAPATPAPAATDPALAATLQNIAGLQADFAALALAATNTVTAEQRVALLNDLAAAAQGTKASRDSIQKTAKQLITLLPGKKIAAAQQNRLARCVHAAFNGAQLTAAQQQVIFDDIQKNLVAAAVPAEDAAQLVALLKAVAAETK
jgi:CCR4-NOT transcriptional regulation complex NOT5 subunit